MRIGKGMLAGTAVLVGVAGLLLTSGVASGTGGYGPYGMMSSVFGIRATRSLWTGPWGMMGALFGGSGAKSAQRYYGYGMMGAYLQGGAAKSGGYPYYGMMGGYFAGGSGQGQSASGLLTPGEAAQAASRVPQGAQVDRQGKTVTFQGRDVRLSAVAAPTGGPELSFEIAGMVNPRVFVPLGAKVTVQVINDDTAAPHDFVVSGIPGAASALLGIAGNSGTPSSTFTFTARTAGSYSYLCTVPGHAAAGMHGNFVVEQ